MKCAFFTPTHVDLTYTRNDVAFNEFADTGNGSRAAKVSATDLKAIATPTAIRLFPNSVTPWAAAAWAEQQQPQSWGDRAVADRF